MYLLEVQGPQLTSRLGNNGGSTGTVVNQRKLTEATTVVIGENFSAIDQSHSSAGLQAVKQISDIALANNNIIHRSEGRLHAVDDLLHVLRTQRLEQIVIADGLAQESFRCFRLIVHSEGKRRQIGRFVDNLHSSGGSGLGGSGGTA